jgi:hypothetical protein
LNSKLTIAALLSLMHAVNLAAEPAIDASGTMLLDSTLQGVELEGPELKSAELKNTELPDQDENSMAWPMLPGENLNDVARLFYPKSRYMQRQFVAKTLHLSKEVQPNLNAKHRFKEPTLLVIPTLKYLANSVRQMKPAPKKQKKQTFSMSYQIEKVPQALVKEYEYLVSKNEFLKQELAKLNEKLIFLQTKLNELKLQFDKTLSIPNTNQQSIQSENQSPAAEPPAKKVFKNLNTKADEPKVAKADTLAINKWVDPNFLLKILGLAMVFGLAVLLFKKHRQSVNAKLNFVASRVQETVADLNGNWQTTKQATAQVTVPKTTQQVQAAKASKEAEINVSSSLEEAKLLMSINRTSDAIAHLKMTIKSSPKASINHWLYLLDVFRKLKLKDEFENYAKELHATFNVLPPVWDNTEVLLAVSNSLQEFPHIMEKLYKTWPEDTAYAYLRGLIADNRGGERIGFGKDVVEEILMLIAVLDTRKELV